MKTLISWLLIKYVMLEIFHKITGFPSKVIRSPQGPAGSIRATGGRRRGPPLSPHLQPFTVSSWCQSGLKNNKKPNEQSAAATPKMSSPAMIPEKCHVRSAHVSWVQRGCNVHQPGVKHTDGLQKPVRRSGLWYVIAIEKIQAFVPKPTVTD